MMSKIKQVSCKVAQVFKRTEDDIVVVNFKNIEEVDLEEYKEVIDAVGIIGKGEKQYILITSGPRVVPTVEARNYISDPESAKYTHARAFLISSLAQRLIGNFVINVQRPKVPMKLFTNESEAIAWLNQIRKLNQVPTS